MDKFFLTLIPQNKQCNSNPRMDASSAMRFNAHSTEQAMQLTPRNT
jgi:hypothetical protein